MAKNWKPTLNSMNFDLQSKGLKKIFKDLNLDIKSFDRSVLVALCKNKLGDKINISDIKRNTETHSDTIYPDDLNIENDYSSIDELLSTFKDKILTSISDKKINLRNINSISFDEDIGMTVFYDDLENEKSFEYRVNIAKQRNFLISHYDEILIRAKAEVELRIARKNNVSEIDKEIEILQERKRKLLKKQ